MLIVIPDMVIKELQNIINISEANKLVKIIVKYDDERNHFVLTCKEGIDFIRFGHTVNKEIGFWKLSAKPFTMEYDVMFYLLNTIHKEFKNIYVLLKQFF